MGDISIDVNEITGPMILKRDELLNEAEHDDARATRIRSDAKNEAAQVLQEGEQAAESCQHAAATKRALAERWNVIIAREEFEAGQPSAVTRTDGEVAQP